jgi:putative phage-type endonuclease
MLIVNCEQGTQEWFNARLGVPTASNFDKIITTEGKPSKQRTKYLYQLAGEAISMSSEDTFQSTAMLRGIELESQARELYSMLFDLPVSKVGLCVTEGEIKAGASPDSLVGEDGLLEIKCPTISTHVSYLLDNKLPTDYFQQVQGQLFVTERKWCDFMSYYPNMRPLIIRVYPDVDFIKALSIELKSFCKELNEIITKIK